MIKTTTRFELIQVDIWGGYKIASLSGAHYFLTIVDDFTRGVWVYLLRYKSEVKRYLLQFCNMVRSQFNCTVKRIQADNGYEFQTTGLVDFYEQEGIVLQTSCTDTPQQNGVVERKHRHIQDTARALRFQASLPIRFWGECILTAVYLINRLPTKATGKTPFELIFGRTATYRHLRVFGCLVYYKDTHAHLDKFGERGCAGLFLGYAASQKGYRIYDLTSRRLITSRDVKFQEDIFPFQDGTHKTLHWIPHPPIAAVPESPDSSPLTSPEHSPTGPEPSSPDASFGPSSSNPTQPKSPSPHTSSVPANTGPTQLDNGPESSSSSPLSGPYASSPGPHAETTCPSADSPAPVVRRSDRVRHRPKYLADYDTNLAPHSGQGSTTNLVRYPLASHVNYTHFKPVYRAFLAAQTHYDEPRFFYQAVREQVWRDSMTREIRALEENGTWSLVFLPPGKRTIAAKWVYKIKFYLDETIERFKARLVAKGYTQIEGQDFHDTFAPVAKHVTIRCLIAIAVNRGWHLHKLDVNNAFLHGDLDEEICMEIPPGFRKPGDTRVCRLHKSLYGQRQASRQWYQKFTTSLCEFGFRSSPADAALFIYQRGSTFVTALIYVDDVILAVNDLDFISQVKQFLDKKFSIKDLGILRYFLGIEVARTFDGVVLNQRKYTLDILEDASVEASRPSSFPIEQNHQLTRTTDDLLADPSPYRRLVGRLLYLTVTRPDINFVVNILSRFVHAPSTVHWDAALRYLKSAPGQGLFFPKNSNLQLTAYCDADWGGCQRTRRSTTGFFISLGGAPISWSTKQQQVVARSSAEAEYRAMASTVSEVVWLRWLLAELGVPQTASTPLHCDNQAALHISNNPVFHERTKHVEMDCHFVRERVMSGDILPVKIHTDQQLADIFTKGLGSDRFHSLLSKLHIRDLHVSVCGGVLGCTDPAHVRDAHAHENCAAAAHVAHATHVAVPCQDMDSSCIRTHCTLDASDNGYKYVTTAIRRNYQ
ncbi:unnamed protein product [Linum trigynum]|uniref:Integrase catalytic domain-containing protein n=1 Tax=Linum trigynum TaxID=586398 RepID=A0AAV2CT39_9ROSI